MEGELWPLPVLTWSPELADLDVQLERDLAVVVNARLDLDDDADLLVREGG